MIPVHVYAEIQYLLERISEADDSATVVPSEQYSWSFMPPEFRECLEAKELIRFDSLASLYGQRFEIANHDVDDFIDRVGADWISKNEI